jgi:hypothetical protein
MDANVDLISAQTIAKARTYSRSSVCGRLLDCQQRSLLDLSDTTFGHVYRVHLTLPSKTNLIDVVSQAIRSLGNGWHLSDMPDIKGASAEWITARSRKIKLEQDVVDESGDHRAPLVDACNGTVVLYFHGGQFW